MGTARKTWTILTLFCLVLIPTVGYSDDFYVDSNVGIDAPGRGTQNQPWATINYALDHINGIEESPHRVLVAGGNYNENVVADPYESIYGGYNPSTWERDLDLFETVIQAGSAGSVVVLSNECTIDGFTLRNGNRDFGGGVYCKNVNAIISNCHITHNQSSGWDSAGSAIYVEGGEDVKIVSNKITNNTGDAIYVNGAVISLENNVISDTLSGHGLVGESATVSLHGDRILRNEGRGISMQNRSVLNASFCIIGENDWSGLSLGGPSNLYKCLICRNNINTGLSGDHNGAGIVCSSNDVAIRGCIICQNTAPYRGGAIYYGCTVFDSIIVSNMSSWGTGGYFLGGSTTLENNYIINNGYLTFNELSHGGLPLTSTNNSVLHNKNGYVVSSLSPGRVTMTNDIFWGNGDDIKFTDVWGNPVEDKQTISFCNIENGDLNGMNNNISVNPDFIGQIGAGILAAVTYDQQRCRTIVTDQSGDYDPNSLARTFLWVSDTAFYVEGNTKKEITVYGDLTQDGGAGFEYTVVDYRLHPLSLCIDAGTNVGAPDHDFEGDDRPVLGRIANRTDIGADEYYPIEECTSIPIGDLNEDCKVDMFDLAIMCSHWLECNLVPLEACW